MGCRGMRPRLKLRYIVDFRLIKRYMYAGTILHNNMTVVSDRFILLHAILYTIISIT